ncbi:hypothetical protein CGK93_10590 [Arthrobacter sp. YN]|nr:hypothetical protein CGK93_10590 [Arthrobacter sp. YN]
MNTTHDAVSFDSSIGKNRSDGDRPEVTSKDANSVEDWSLLTGKHVRVYRGGGPIREGVVEAVSSDSQIIWLQHSGTNLRVLFERAEGYEVQVRT